MDVRDAHQAALLKQEKMKDLKSALNIKKDHEFGAAFDLEL